MGATRSLVPDSGRPHHPSRAHAVQPRPRAPASADVDRVRLGVQPARALEDLGAGLDAGDVLVVAQQIAPDECLALRAAACSRMSFSAFARTPRPRTSASTARPYVRHGHTRTLSTAAHDSRRILERAFGSMPHGYRTVAPDRRGIAALPRQHPFHFASKRFDNLWTPTPAELLSNHPHSPLFRIAHCRSASQQLGELDGHPRRGRPARRSLGEHGELCPQRQAVHLREHPAAGRAEHPASSATTRTRAPAPWPAAGRTSSR